MVRKTDPAKRDAIIFHARKLFKEKGVEGTTIPEIANAAGIATGTVYLYFKSKMEIVNALCEYYLRGHIQAINSELDSPAGKALEDIVHAAFLHASKNADLVRLIDQRRSDDGRTSWLEADKVLLGVLRTWMGKCMEEGSMIPYNTVVLAELVSGLVEWISKICFAWSDMDPTRYEDTLVKLLQNALLKNYKET